MKMSWTAADIRAIVREEIAAREAEIARDANAAAAIGWELAGYPDAAKRLREQV
jgi:hypothetical protein